MHAYPRELAVLVRERWPRAISAREELASSAIPRVPCPDLAVLEPLLSVCYQASLLHEEGRPVTFRLALIEPGTLSETEGPPAGLQRLVFSQFRPLDADELRRLAAAAPFHRALVGACVEGEVGLQIWGVIHSGPRWLQSVRGGRDVRQKIAPALIVSVTGPGRLLVSAGIQTVAELNSGTLTGVALDVFQARWLTDVFTDMRGAQLASHASARAQAGAPWAELDPSFGPTLAEHVLRRIVATIRGTHHGGTLVVLPSSNAEALVADHGHIALKYAFRDEEPRRRILTLIVHAMNELAHMHRPSQGSDHVGWRAYEESQSARLAEVDEAVFELAHLVAAFAGVDGAVVLTTRLEILGFGGEITGDLSKILSVARALDLGGDRREWVRTDRVGTRHRSAYRLCQSFHGALVIVVSHDGGVRFVRWHEGSVTYWDQIATGPWEV